MLIRDTASGNLEVQDSIMSTKQNANLLFMGPASGSAALGSFRSLVAADLPGGGGAGSAYFPMFWGFKACNNGGTVTTIALVGMVNVSTVGTIAFQNASASKALRGRFTSSATAGSSAGLCEAVGAPTLACIRTLGTTNILLANVTLQQTTNMRLWFGLTDISPQQINPTAAVLTAAANAVGGTTVYSSTFGATAVGQYFTVAGFVNAANNGGPWLCTAANGTTLTLANPSGVTETHAGTATFGVAINFRSDAPNANFIGFRYSTSAGDTKYQCVAQTDASHQTVTPESGSHTINTTSEYQLAIHWDSFNSRVVFYIGDDQVGAISTNLPSTSLAMQPFIIIDNVGTANGQAFDLSQLRGQ
jgi:hypothetical protein